MSQRSYMFFYNDNATRLLCKHESKTVSHLSSLVLSPGAVHSPQIRICHHEGRGEEMVLQWHSLRHILQNAGRRCLHLHPLLTDPSQTWLQEACLKHWAASVSDWTVVLLVGWFS